MQVISRALPVGSAVEVKSVSLAGIGDRFERSVAESFGKGRGNYVAPTATEMSGYQEVVGDVLQALRNHDAGALAQAGQKASGLGFDLSSFPTMQRGYYRLEEKPEERHGWGSVWFNANPHRGLVVEVPHPSADMGTPELGMRAFEALDADVLILAGANRNNRAEPSPDVLGRVITDVAHTRATMFQAAHQAAAGPGSVVLQVHGFSAWKTHQQFPAFPADRQVVLSDGHNDHYDPPHLVHLDHALEAKGFNTSIVSFQDPASSTLSGDTNVQNADMEARGLVGQGHLGEFIHMETETSLRTGPHREESFSRLLNALQDSLGS